MSTEAITNSLTRPEVGMSEKQDQGGFKSRVRAFLFHSERLPDASWQARHRVIVGIVVAHAPLIIVIAAMTKKSSLLHSLMEAAALLGMAGAAILPRFKRATQELLATTALLTCSALFVHVTGGSIEAHFHFFVVLPLVSLYQSWPAFILALVYVVLHHGALGALAPGSVFNHPAAVKNPWLWALIHAAFVTAASAVYVTMWRLNESARNEARDLYQRLYEGQRSLVLQLEEATKMKGELISIVSHELRTPLTSILGFGAFLQDDERGSRDERKSWLDRLMRQGDRLQFTIENLLGANSSKADLSATCNVKQILDEVVAEHADRSDDEQVRVVATVPSSLVARVQSSALRLILANLINNAMKHSHPGTVATIGAQLEPGGRSLVIAMTNKAEAIPEEDRSRIFGAFVQLDSSSTRHVGGVGLGLYIVRETAAAYGGSVRVSCEDDQITFSVELPAQSSKVRSPDVFR